jgi:hypothetical protein
MPDVESWQDGSLRLDDKKRMESEMTSKRGMDLSHTIRIDSNNVLFHSQDLALVAIPTIRMSI